MNTYTDDGVEFQTPDSDYLEFSYQVINGTSLETISAIYCNEYIEKYLGNLD